MSTPYEADLPQQQRFSLRRGRLSTSRSSRPPFHLWHSECVHSFMLENHARHSGRWPCRRRNSGSGAGSYLWL
jgi:hypothetical protein